MVPSSSASRKHKVLFGKAARATRRVCSGTEYEEGGGSDIQSSSRKLQENGFANSIRFCLRNRRNHFVPDGLQLGSMLLETMSERFTQIADQMPAIRHLLGLWCA